jgi:hypothetical protein
MRFTIKLALEDENGTHTTEDIICLKRNTDDRNFIGISLLESKQILKLLQSKIILNQALKHIECKRKCTFCNKTQKINRYHSVQYRTLFGIVNLSSPRLVHCKCHNSRVKTFSPLSDFLSDKN